MSKRRIINNNEEQREQQRTTVNDSCSLEHNHRSTWLSPPAGAEVRDLQEEQCVGLPSEELPNSKVVLNTPNLIQDENLPWDFVKIDLFDNSLKNKEKNISKQHLRLSMQIKKIGQNGFTKFNALMNTPLRTLRSNVKNVDPVLWDTPHYQLLEQNYYELKTDHPDVRASRFYMAKAEGHKGNAVDDFSALLFRGERDGDYYVNIIVGNQQWLWLLKSNNLSEAQRKTALISSIQIKKNSTRTRVKAKDVLF
jgi:hypothetical protein